MHWQPLSVCKTLLVIKVQLSTSYNLLKLSGYSSGRELLDLSKKLWCSIGERFFRNAAKEKGKKSRLVANHQENGVALDLDKTRPRLKTIAEYAKDRESDEKKFDVRCMLKWNGISTLLSYLYV